MLCAILRISTATLRSGDAGAGGKYQTYQQKIVDWTTRRDNIALEMKTVVDRAALASQPVNSSLASYLPGLGQDLMNEAIGFAALLAQP